HDLVVADSVVVLAGQDDDLRDRGVGVLVHVPLPMAGPPASARYLVWDECLHMTRWMQPARHQRPQAHQSPGRVQHPLLRALRSLQANSRLFERAALWGCRLYLRVLNREMAAREMIDQDRLDGGGVVAGEVLLQLGDPPPGGLGDELVGPANQLDPGPLG